MGLIQWKVWEALRFQTLPLSAIILFSWFCGSLNPGQYLRLKGNLTNKEFELFWEKSVIA